MRTPLEPSEHDIQTTILSYLNIRGHYCWRQNSGVMRLESNTGSRFFRAGFKGIADIIGIAQNSRFIAVEVKRIGNVPSLEQKAFLEEIMRRGGYAVVAYSVEDIIKEGL